MDERINLISDLQLCSIIVKNPDWIFYSMRQLLANGLGFLDLSPDQRDSQSREALVMLRIGSS
jgi:hypothetical protein